MIVLLYITCLYIYVYIYICMLVYIYISVFPAFSSFFLLIYQIIFQITIIAFPSFSFFFNASEYVRIPLTKILNLYLFLLINLSSIFFYDSFVQLRIAYYIAYYVFKLLISSCQSLSLPTIEHMLNI